MALSPILAAKARGFASTYHVKLESGIHESCTPVLMPLDDHGRPLEHVTNQAGVDFYRSRVDYYRPDCHVAASRLISMVLPGYRTNSAFVPGNSATKVLEVHSGVGNLILGTPPDPREDFSTTFYKLDPQVTPTVKIPANCFYTLEAASWNHGPFVVSELIETSGNGELASGEIVLEPGQEFVETPDGSVKVPEDFAEQCFI